IVVLPNGSLGAYRIIKDGAVLREFEPDYLDMTKDCPPDTAWGEIGFLSTLQRLADGMQLGDEEAVGMMLTQVGDLAHPDQKKHQKWKKLGRTRKGRELMQRLFGA